MKIAQVCPYDIDRPGGVQAHILDLSSALAAIGHNVTIIAPHVSRGKHASREEARRDEVTIVKVGAARLISINKTAFEFSLAFGEESRRLDQLMSSADFDVVHLHTPLSPFLSMQVLNRSTAANVGTFHAVPPETGSGAAQRALYGMLNRRLASRLDHVILASRVQRDLHLAAGTVLPPCVNLRRFGCGAAPLEGLKDERINILFLGRLEPRKGASILLKAFAELRQDISNAKLLIAGDGSERHRLEGLVERERIPDVVFLGRIDDLDLPSLYATCDVFCAPAIYGEGFGIVLAEAMASGKPIIAAANAGYKTVLTGEASSLLAAPGDASDLRNKLERLITQSDLRARLGEWGRDEARSYDSKELLPAFLAVYEEARRSRSRRIHRAGRVHP
ncbi:MAG: glycosyltransferase family 4 protein [Bradyrhizobium sp.]|nr:glycosyltransferase family 4 protein [Bradyrhizobium sp.]